MLIDTHAHVQDTAFDEDRADVIERAVDAGIAMITVGVDLATSQAAVALAAQHPGIYATVGVHPHEAKSLTPDIVGELRRLCLHPKVVAIGETGLDWRRNLSPRAEQRAAFAAHLALAVELDLPVIVHNRDADADVLDVWRSVPGVRGVMHAFSSDVAMAESSLAAGLCISLGGPLTYKNAEMTRAVARRVPLDCLLIETDCPYLPPVPWRGQRNEPSYISLIAEALARVRGLPMSEVAAATTHNAQALFKLPVRGG
jgi:TatD DNase family protein